MSREDNMKYYNYFREVPKEAKKPITGGRLNGMTDINPMWRIRVLTEMFGACGEGWYYEIEKKEVYGLPTEVDPKEVVATVDIALYVKTENGWSKPIYGTGGSMLMAQQIKGAYVNDEAFKMALTDAISVACKALGIGADVYWQSDNTKYNDNKKLSADGMDKLISKTEQKTLQDYVVKMGSNIEGICSHYKVGSIAELTKAQYGEIVATFMAREEKQKNAR